MTSFGILTVCTGNICRSPLAEQLLRAELAGLDVAVASAGTNALVGHPMDDRAAVYSRQLGGSPDEAFGRQLTADQVRQSDLVLAASREHRRAVVELLPRSTHFAFTVREFARLLESLDDRDWESVATAPDSRTRLLSLVEIAASNRGVSELPEDADDDDIIDPYRQDDAVYAESIGQLVPAVRAIAGVLRRASGGGGEE
jgi:protein-tyrosine phosphatase